jgi:hypothetical protein
MYPIAKPTTTQKYTTSVSWYTRIPRRYRPVLVVALCFVSFVFIYATHGSSDAATPSYPQEEELDIGRRYIETPTWESESGYSGSAQPDAPPAIELSAEDEYAALISVSLSLFYVS